MHRPGGGSKSIVFDGKLRDTLLQRFNDRTNRALLSRLCTPPIPSAFPSGGSALSRNYASAFSYCHWPSAGGKSTQELDPTPLLWPTSGDNQHPPPEKARKGPVTAGASAELKEAANKKRAEAGKPEQRFRDIDLWPVVVNEGIRPGRDAVEKVVAYGKRCGGLAMSQWCFDNEQKIKELVSRAWRFEGAEESVERLGKSRMKILNEAASSSCVCGGRWAAAARELFFLNDLDLNRWSAAVRYSFENGRQAKGSLVCHAGLEGNEGCHLVE